MQLETGKSKTGVLGSFQTIIKEEGCVRLYLRTFRTHPSHAASFSFGRLYRGLLPPLLMEAPKRATKLYVSESHGASGSFAHVLREVPQTTSGGSSS